jgi:hypothetical protein
MKGKVFCKRADRDFFQLSLVEILRETKEIYLRKIHPNFL